MRLLSKLKMPGMSQGEPLKPTVILDWLLAGCMGLLLPFSPFVASVIALDTSYIRRCVKTTVKVLSLLPRGGQLTKLPGICHSIANFLYPTRSFAQLHK